MVDENQRRSSLIKYFHVMAPHPVIKSTSGSENCSLVHLYFSWLFLLSDVTPAQ